jgi:hypothetical protein
LNPTALAPAPPGGREAGGRQLLVKPFPPHGASYEEYAKFAAFRNRIRAEQLPEDPPVPLGEYVSRLKGAALLRNTLVWAA